MKSSDDGAVETKTKEKRTGSMCDKLGGSSVLIMLCTGHRNHVTEFLCPNVNKSSDYVATGGMHTNDLKNEGQALPRRAAALGAEHRVCTDDVSGGGEAFEEQIARVKLD